jgi:membrane-associated HD superfamily phosphohydrolase
MIADAVESAVRSLKNPSPEEIDAIIDKIIVERLNDTQLADSPLTLKDIKTIAVTFSRILRGMQHNRIKYQENLAMNLKTQRLICLLKC